MGDTWLEGGLFVGSLGGCSLEFCPPSAFIKYGALNICSDDLDGLLAASVETHLSDVKVSVKRMSP